eukprot:306728-Hanusia_phi.AAC.2
MIRPGGVAAAHDLAGRVPQSFSCATRLHCDWHAAGRKGTSPGTRKHCLKGQQCPPVLLRASLHMHSSVISLPVAGPGPLCAPARPEA